MLALPFRAFVDLLRCPECQGAFAFDPATQPYARSGEYGVLTCACFAYPVVGGVPILKKGPVTANSISDARVVVDGPTPDELVRLVRAGEGLEALLRLVAFPVCPWPMNRTAAGRALCEAEPLRSAGLAVRRRALRRRLLRGPDGLTAEDWFATFYWRSPTLFDPFSYFFYRFGQPRHLAALSLASALPASEKPVLDLACGYGHLLHNLAAGEAARPAVGLDQNFHQAWVGRHWVAPAARFVCGDADRPLPFASGVFAAAVCADAFHYFERKAACAGELRRVAAGGTLVLARVGNRLVGPNEGEELPPEGYAALLAPWPHRTRVEDALVAGYLRGDGPDLTHPGARDGAAGQKWLYLVASEDASVFRRHGPFAAWPHAAGQLALNPLYEPQRANEAVELALRFPSPWYAFENGGMAGYHRAAVKVDIGVLEDAHGGRSTPRVDELVEGFVVLGLPERYARRSGRPWAVAANRALSHLAGRLRGAVASVRAAGAALAPASCLVEEFAVLGLV